MEGRERGGRRLNHRLTGSETLSASALPSTSSALVSLFKKLLSLTGLPAWAPCGGRPATLSLAAWTCWPPGAPPPLGATAGPEGLVRWGMFSGTGCSDPTAPVSTLSALPALERA